VIDMAIYSTDELQRAHAEISSMFAQPGSVIPEGFADAMADYLWSRLVMARASINRYHLRKRAIGAGLHIHHTTGETLHVH